MPNNPVKPLIVGLEGLTLTAAEKDYIRTHQPYGFVLFQRNCESPDQVKALCDSLHDLSDVEAPLPVLIDQEGGRVARLKPPHWREAPPAGLFADIAEYNLAVAARLAYLNARLMAAELHALGITVDCAPVADLLIPGCHDIVGDRAYGEHPVQVAYLARQVAEGLLDGGVLPVVKHIPGHGRALCDSHESLPVVEATLEEMESSDFVPFWDLADVPFAMTAHITYTALDKDNPATLSSKVVQYIREVIGFSGVLMTDDVSMKALSGDIGQTATASLKAGCELVLHCNGQMGEMQTIGKALEPVDGVARERLEAVWNALPLYHDEEEMEELQEEYAALFNEATGDKAAMVG